MQSSTGPAGPADAQLRAKALSRWEGEGGALAPKSAAAADTLDESELRILARIGAAALAQWDGLPDALREAVVAGVCKPAAPGDRSRAKARIAAFVRDYADR